MNAIMTVHVGNILLRLTIAGDWASNSNSFAGYFAERFDISRIHPGEGMRVVVLADAIKKEFPEAIIIYDADKLTDRFVAPDTVF